MQFLAILPFLALANGFIVCPDNICASLDCAAVDEASCNGQVIQNGGFCGCCDVCHVQLGEGDSCFGTFLLGVPSQAKCGAGLHCDHHTSACVKDSVRRQATTGPCADALAKVNARLLEAEQHGMPLMGLERPNCGADGFYAGKQVSGSQAYCVDKSGMSMIGYMVNRWEADGMNCECARDLDTYMKSGLIGKMFHCDARGNYATTQCMGSVCYCVDKLGNQLAGKQSVNIGEMDKLIC